MPKIKHPPLLDQVWGIIPARGGSKSIPYKNLHPIGGRSLLEYQVLAGRASGSLDRLVCSTEDARIAQACADLEVEVVPRPVALAQDMSSVIDVLEDLFLSEAEKCGGMPWAFVLLQPTSPFILPVHISDCVQALRHDKRAGSSQTVAKLPHNHHAFNQRQIINGRVGFRFARQRRLGYSKQTKPTFYSFGNVVASRTLRFLSQRNVFATPSVPVLIERAYALDVDGPEDVAYADFCIEKGVVELQHLRQQGGQQ